MATARAPSAYRRGRPGSASTSPTWSSTSSPTRPAITTAWNPSGAAPPRNSGKDKEDRNSAPESASQHIDTHPLRAYTLEAFGAVAQPGGRHAGVCDRRPRALPATDSSLGLGGDRADRWSPLRRPRLRACPAGRLQRLAGGGGGRGSGLAESKHK